MVTLSISIVGTQLLFDVEWHVGQNNWFSHVNVEWVKDEGNSSVDRVISEQCSKSKTGGENLGTTNISNTNLLVLNNCRLSPDSKSELISFGRVF